MRNRSIAVLLTVVAVSVCTFALPAQAGRLYWSATAGDAVPGLEGWLASVRTDGSGFVEELYEMPGGAESTLILGQVAVDSGSRRLYWVERNVVDNSSTIVRGDAEACQHLSLENQVGDIALDVTGGKIYWTADRSGPDNSEIKRANLDFSSVELLLDGLTSASGIGVDALAGKIYWHDGFNDTIFRSDLDGSNVETQFVVENLGQFQIDPAGQKIYWTEVYPFDGLKRADLDGSNVEALAPQVEYLFVVDVNASVVYWKTGGGMVGPTPTIRSANLDGSNEVLVLEDWQADANSLALDPDDDLIDLACGVDVPALGSRGAAMLVLLLLAIGILAVRRS